MIDGIMEHACQDTRELILRAGLFCFAEHGFDGTSMRMIADQAKRPLSLLSHHFGNKEGLYLEVFRQLYKSLAQNNGVEPPPEGGYSPRNKSEAIRLLREQLHTISRDCAQSAPDDPQRELAARLWMRELRSPRPSLLPLIQQQAKPVTETIKRCLHVLRPDLDEREIAFLGRSIMGQAIAPGLLRGLNQAVWGEDAFPGSPFQASEWLVDLCLHGLLGLGVQE